MRRAVGAVGAAFHRPDLEMPDASKETLPRPEHFGSFFIRLPYHIGDIKRDPNLELTTHMQYRSH